MSPEFSVPTLMYGIETPFRFGWLQLVHYAVGASESVPFLRWVTLEQLSSRMRPMCGMWPFTDRSVELPSKSACRNLVHSSGESNPTIAGSDWAPCASHKFSRIFL